MTSGVTDIERDGIPRKGRSQNARRIEQNKEKCRKNVFSSENIWSCQKKAVPLHAFFALYARTRAETILIINKIKFTKQW